MADMIDKEAISSFNFGETLVLPLTYSTCTV